MRDLAFVYLLTLSTVSFATNNTISLQCSTGGNNTYAIILDVGNETLSLPMFNQLDFGTYAQIESNNQNTLAFFKRPASKNNGIPMLIEIPSKILNAKQYSVHTVNVRVSQNWPGPINENVYYAYHLTCTKVSSFVF